MLRTYRKKCPVITALLWDGQDFLALHQFIYDAVPYEEDSGSVWLNSPYGGRSEAKPGYFIVKDERGQFSARRPSEFLEEYEAVK